MFWASGVSSGIWDLRFKLAESFEIYGFDKGSSFGALRLLENL